MPKEKYSSEIEIIRSRAKDNKASNAKEFTILSESYLEKLRNTMLLTSFALVGYLGAVSQSLSICEGITITLSIVSAFTSYFFAFRYSLTTAHKYSDMEKNLSTAYVSQTEYENMLTKEMKIIKKYTLLINRQRGLSIIFIMLQFLFLLFSLFYILFI